MLKSLDEGKLTCDKPQTLFNEISQIFEDDVGGTAGAVCFFLLACFFQLLNYIFE